jgi:hypothetical protein
MIAKYAYGIWMPDGIGLLTKTIADSEKGAIKSFLEFESKLTWEQALDAGYKLKKLVVVELK